MKPQLKTIALVTFLVLTLFSAKAQSTGGADVLGIWAYVTIDESTPIVDNRYYDIVFPTPPESIDRIDFAGLYAYNFFSSGGYTHVYFLKGVIDTEYGEIKDQGRDQMEIEVFVDKYNPVIGGGLVQCYYYVVLCFHQN